MFLQLQVKCNYRADKEDNLKDEIVVTFVGGEMVQTAKKRKDIQAGDVIYLEGQRGVPADMLVLHTSFHGDGNQCYVETANIDGETNLKLKEAPPDVKHYIKGDKPNAHLFSGHIEFEPPNKSIYTFAGAMTIEGSAAPIALGPNNVLLRGSLFSNTEWAYGVALYTGQETKLQMNNRHAPSKLSKIELYANQAIKTIFCAQVYMLSSTLLL
jgi:phospholipid-transporting ATPase